jgi:hypothetical protein
MFDDAIREIENQPDRQKTLGLTALAAVAHDLMASEYEYVLLSRLQGYLVDGPSLAGIVRATKGLLIVFEPHESIRERCISVYHIYYFSFAQEGYSSGLMEASAGLKIDHKGKKSETFYIKRQGTELDKILKLARRVRVPGKPCGGPPGPSTARSMPCRSLPCCKPRRASRFCWKTNSDRPLAKSSLSSRLVWSTPARAQSSVPFAS